MYMGLTIPKVQPIKRIPVRPRLSYGRETRAWEPKAPNATKMVVEQRQGCPAPKHDSRRAKYSHGCTCPAARQDDLQAHRRYNQNNPEKVRKATRNYRARKAIEAGRDPSLPKGTPAYQDPSSLSDWVVVERLVSGLRTEASRYDRWEAIKVLALKGLSISEINLRIGGKRRTVERFYAWLRENGYLNGIRQATGTELKGKVHKVRSPVR